ncbi:hydroxymethylglutaryl-CoA lyase [Azospirillum sp. TSO35-2]|uniref:hydroxymethylglutaryl-CoA lyase n=1 Tax=Azospirillum sp. TSO35-2 TaxID=716796 RepID=UPI000D652848|nr:hydroxymethylglutaryl-CoA lyase [Azospirillum sp. TSO35-2]
MAERVRLVEVGPRDGLQNEARVLPSSLKLELIRRLGEAGLTTIEATAFVSPAWVPQMADHAEVIRGLRRIPGVAYPVLVPNMQGFERAMAAGVREIAVFAAASESFSQRNINCSIDDSFGRFRPIFQAARERGIPVRGYVSCAIHCPYEGVIAPDAVAAVAGRLFEAGCAEISLGDTIGTGTPAQVQAMLSAVSRTVPLESLAGHFHDTYGMAVANVHTAYQFGVRTFDASVAGLGGCPYASGASGNVATEDLVYLFNGMEIETGVDLERLVAVSVWISREFGRSPASRVTQAVGVVPPDVA